MLNEFEGGKSSYDLSYTIVDNNIYVKVSDIEFNLHPRDYIDGIVAYLKITNTGAVELRHTDYSHDLLQTEATIVFSNIEEDTEYDLYIDWNGFKGQHLYPSKHITIQPYYDTNYRFYTVSNGLYSFKVNTSLILNNLYKGYDRIFEITTDSTEGTYYKELKKTFKVPKYITMFSEDFVFENLMPNRTIGLNLNVMANTSNGIKSIHTQHIEANTRPSKIKIYPTNITNRTVNFKVDNLTINGRLPIKKTVIVSQLRADTSKKRLLTAMAEENQNMIEVVLGDLTPNTNYLLLVECFTENDTQREIAFVSRYIYTLAKSLEIQKINAFNDNISITLIAEETVNYMRQLDLYIKSSTDSYYTKLKGYQIGANVKFEDKKLTIENLKPDTEYSFKAVLSNENSIYEIAFAEIKTLSINNIEAPDIVFAMRDLKGSGYADCDPEYAYFTIITKNYDRKLSPKNISFEFCYKDSDITDDSNWYKAGKIKRYADKPIAFVGVADPVVCNLPNETQYIYIRSRVDFESMTAYGKPKEYILIGADVGGSPKDIDLSKVISLGQSNDTIPAEIDTATFNLGQTALHELLFLKAEKTIIENVFNNSVDDFFARRGSFFAYNKHEVSLDVSYLLSDTSLWTEYNNTHQMLYEYAPYPLVNIRIIGYCMYMIQRCWNEQEPFRKLMKYEIKEDMPEPMED
jgi:hypothetical protein